MARERAESDGDGAVGPGAESAAPDGNRVLLDRRSYLKLTGAASLVGAGVGAASGSAAAAEDYDVIEARGQTIWVRDGETFENTLIDFSNGNYARIIAEGNGWVIRNVGFVGTHRHDYHAMVLSTNGGNGLVENCYLGDGCVRPSNYRSHGQCGIFVHRRHAGHIDIRNCNIQNWPNNGIYANAPQYEGGGTVHIENCFSANNYVSNFRLGTNGSEIRDCVAYNDSNGRYNGRCMWIWPPGEVRIDNCHFSSGPYNGAIHIGRDGKRTQVALRDTHHDGIRERGNVSIRRLGGNGSNPQRTMPAGVPQSAVEAASGDASGSPLPSRPEGDHPDLQHIFEFVADGEDEPTDYYFEIEEGPIEPSTFRDAVVEEGLQWVSEDGTRAAGRVVDGSHAWEFDALLVDVTVDGPATAIIDGAVSNLDRYPREGATGDEWKQGMPWHDEDDGGEGNDEDDGGDEGNDESDGGGDHPDLQHVFEFVADGEDEPTDYYFEIQEGPIGPSTVNGAVIEEELQWISDDGTCAAGRVTNGRHAWEFDTLLVDVTVDGPATAIINGTESSLSRYPLDGASGDEWKQDMPWHDEDDTSDEDEDYADDGSDHPDLQHVFEFVADGEAEPTDYYFEIEEGPIEPSTVNGAVIEEELQWVSEDGTRAAGRVTGARHAWEFDTLLVDVTVDGPATAIINGTESHLPRYPLDGATGDEWKQGMPWHEDETDDGDEGNDGSDGDGDHPDLQHLFEFVAEGEDEPTEYYFEIEEGPIEPSTANGAAIEDGLHWVSDDGTRAAGLVANGRHAWEFDTLLVDVTVDGPATAIINGTESYLPRYPQPGASGDEWKQGMPWHEDLPENVLVVDGTGTEGATSYEFTVSGEVVFGDGPSEGDDPVIDGNTVTGRIGGWTDVFRFDGELEVLTVDGDASVSVNGELVDPNDYGEALPHVLTVTAGGDPASYEFSVDGSLVQVDEADDPITDGSNVFGTTAEASLAEGVHWYRFSGSLTDFTVVDGDLSVTIDDERVDLGEYTDVPVHPHAVVIDGTDAEALSVYSFTVDGDVVRSISGELTDDGDVFDGDRVRGGVAGTTHAYWFDGDLTDFTLDGDATADVLYNARDR